MSNIQMMAVKISKKTWPIATACLPGGFAREPFPKVKGCYLVINEVERQDWEDHRAPSGISLGNAWWSAEQFHHTFNFVNPEKKDEFTPVEFKVQDLPMPPMPAMARVGYNTPGNRRLSEKEIAKALDISVVELRNARTLARKIAIAERV